MPDDVPAHPVLKPYTNYRCLSCRKFGHWTGAHKDPSPNEHLCPHCGAELVADVDDGRRWRVSFEMVHPDSLNGHWTPVARETASEHDARSQYEGLQSLMSQGEPIRNVGLEVSTTAWQAIA